MRYLLHGVVAAAAVGVVGCGQPVPDEKECGDLKRKLDETKAFITRAEATDAAHIEELLAAAPSYEVSLSGTKKAVLRDARKREAKLSAQLQACH